MLPPLVMGAGISAGASLLGGVLGNRSNAREAARNREFQERMRATQYQTAVQDLRLAGLNPMLAYTQGGAGTPSGAVARQEDVVSPAVASAAQVASVMSTLANQAADTENKEQLTEKIKADTLNVLEDTHLKNRLGRLYGFQGNSAREQAFHDEATLQEKIRGTLASLRIQQHREPEEKASGEFWRGAGDFGSMLSGAKNLSDLAPLFKFLLGRMATR